MPVYYLDASAIVKRYRREEQGSDVLSAIVDDASPEDVFLTSYFSTLEVTAALTRSISNQENRREALARFDRDVTDVFQIWPFDQGIIQGAIAIAERHRLRAGDAIHLATALEIFSLVGAETENVMVSSDRELLLASSEWQIVTLDPLDTAAITRLDEMRSADEQSDS